MTAEYTGNTEFKCDGCGFELETKNQKEVTCPKCDSIMTKIFGGRSADVKDYKWRDAK